MATDKILIVDDEQAICTLIQSYLDKMNYTSAVAYDAASALEKVRAFRPDLIILDVMLPDMYGIDLCLEIRKLTNSPILFLSCKGESIDKISALSAGGDDYVTKPFLPEELVARIRAHLRRARLASEPVLKETVFNYNGLTVNLDNYEVSLDGKKIKLTAKEFDLLAVLIKNPKRVFSAEQLFEQVWKSESLSGDSKTIMVYISSLRKKLERGQNAPQFIINIRGFGYKFNG